MNTPKALPQTNLNLNRFNLILAVLLVAQVVLAGLIYWSQAASTAEVEGGLLLKDIGVDNITSLTITDNEGEQIVLARKDSGWVLPKAEDYPVVESKITPILEKLANLKTNRMVTQTADSHKRLQVAADNFVRRLELTLNNDTRHTLYLGSSAGPQTSHIRLDGQNKTYLTNDLTGWETSALASNWVDTLYFSVPPEELVSFTLQNANGEFTFEKDAADNWTLVGLADDEEANAAAISGLVNRITSVRLTEPLGKEAKVSYGLDKPQATITLKAKTEAGDEHTYTLRLGNQNEETEQYVLHASNSDYYVQVNAFLGDGFIEKTRADFIQQPPAPETE